MMRPRPKSAGPAGRQKSSSSSPQKTPRSRPTSALSRSCPGGQTSFEKFFNEIKSFCVVGHHLTIAPPTPKTVAVDKHGLARPGTPLARRLITDSNDGRQAYGMYDAKHIQRAHDASHAHGAYDARHTPGGADTINLYLSRPTSPKESGDVLQNLLDQAKELSTTGGVGYDESFLLAGGGQISQFRDMSEEIRARVERQFRAVGDKKTQPSEYRLKSIDDLYCESKDLRELFDTLGQRMARVMECIWMRGPEKKRQRSTEKVMIRYGGDVTQLSDIQRGTFIFHSSDGRSEIEMMYLGLNKLTQDPEFMTPEFTLVCVEDRFQKGFTSDYKDIQLSVSLREHVVEFQANCASIYEAKSKGGGHKSYTVTRQINEKILQSCVLNNQETVGTVTKCLYSRVANPNAAQDLVKMKSLHHAAANGNEELVRLLLDNGADALALDADFRLPLHRAIIRHGMRQQHSQTAVSHGSWGTTLYADLAWESANLGAAELLLGEMDRILKLATCASLGSDASLDSTIGPPASPSHIEAAQRARKILVNLTLLPKAVREVDRLLAFSLDMSQGQWLGCAQLAHFAHFLYVLGSRDGPLVGSPFHTWARLGYRHVIDLGADFLESCEGYWERSPIGRGGPFEKVRVPTCDLWLHACDEQGNSCVDIAASVNQDRAEIVNLLREKGVPFRTSTQRSIGPRTRELLAERAELSLVSRSKLFASTNEWGEQLDPWKLLEQQLSPEWQDQLKDLLAKERQELIEAQTEAEQLKLENYDLNRDHETSPDFHRLQEEMAAQSKEVAETNERAEQLAKELKKDRNTFAERLSLMSARLVMEKLKTDSSKSEARLLQCAMGLSKPSAGDLVHSDNPRAQPLVAIASFPSFPSTPPIMRPEDGTIMPCIPRISHAPDAEDTAGQHTKRARSGADGMDVPANQWSARQFARATEQLERHVREADAAWGVRVPVVDHAVETLEKLRLAWHAHDEHWEQTLRTAKGHHLVRVIGEAEKWMSGMGQEDKVDTFHDALVYAKTQLVEWRAQHAEAVVGLQDAVGLEELVAAVEVAKRLYLHPDELAVYEKRLEEHLEERREQQRVACIELELCMGWELDSTLRYAESVGVPSNAEEIVLAVKRKREYILQRRSIARVKSLVVRGKQKQTMTEAKAKLLTHLYELFRARMFIVKLDRYGRDKVTKKRLAEKEALEAKNKELFYEELDICLKEPTLERIDKIRSYNNKYKVNAEQVAIVQAAMECFRALEVKPSEESLQVAEKLHLAGPEIARAHEIVEASKAALEEERSRRCDSLAKAIKKRNLHTLIEAIQECENCGGIDLTAARKLRTEITLKKDELVRDLDELCNDENTTLEELSAAVSKARPYCPPSSTHMENAMARLSGMIEQSQCDGVLAVVRAELCTACKENDAKLLEQAISAAVQASIPVSDSAFVEAKKMLKSIKEADNKRWSRTMRMSMVADAAEHATELLQSALTALKPSVDGLRASLEAAEAAEVGAELIKKGRAKLKQLEEAKKHKKAEKEGKMNAIQKLRKVCEEPNKKVNEIREAMQAALQAGVVADHPEIKQAKSILGAR